MRMKQINEPWAQLSVRALTRCLGMLGAPFDELYSVVSPEPVAWSRVKQVPDGPDSRRGTYIVVFHVDAHADEVTIGRLGTFDFPAGYYCYVGSAFGGGGVRTRTARHRTPVKANKKWNIDYLTPHARAVEVWWTHDEIKRECRWSDALAASPGFTCPAPEFGARDCKKCPAHLYFSVRRPRVHDFASRLMQMVPGHAPMYRLRIDRDVRRGGEAGKSSGRVAEPRPDPGSNLEGRFRG